MDSRNTILNELQTISPVVAGIGPVMPYQVPDGYFDKLAGEILQRVKAADVGSVQEELAALSPFLSRLEKKTPFQLPAGYFEELTDNAVAGAKAIEFVNEELENLSPLMNSLKSKQVYEVPSGYFEQFPAATLEKAKAIQPAKVISMPLNRKIFRYAAAAMVTGIITLAAWWFTRPGEEIVPPVVVENIEKVTDDELQRYLESQTVAPDEIPVSTNTDEIDSNDMTDMLADVSDEELQQYLEKYSTIKKLPTN